MTSIAIIALLFASAGLGDATPASSLRGGAIGSPAIEEAVVELGGDGCTRILNACCGPKGDKSDCQPTPYRSGREARAAGACNDVCLSQGKSGCSLLWGDDGDCYKGTARCYYPTNMMNSGMSIQEACFRQKFDPELREAYECEGGEYPFACCKGPAEIPDSGDKFGTCRVIPNGQDELAVE